VAHPVTANAAARAAPAIQAFLAAIIVVLHQGPQGLAAQLTFPNT
jgi:hypothetical protein